MRFDVITIFPEMFSALTGSGITSRARQAGLWDLACWNPRDDATDAYRRIDDRPYGGGPGMVMLAAPMERCLERIQGEQIARLGAHAPVIHLSPRGKPLTHRRVQSLALESSLTLVAGRYEALDERFIERHVDEEVCIGDFIVSGGELPAMMLIDAVVRLLPGAVNDPLSVEQESFAEGLLDCPHYTRPEVLGGVPVPPILMSGHHERIARWRREQSLRLTAQRRPDLIVSARAAGRLSGADEAYLAGMSSPLV